MRIYSGKSSRPTTRRGVPATGRIVTLWTGQGHGVIRTEHHRRIFFHRGDVSEGTIFNDLRIGDRVTFELFDDRVSGARALHLRRHHS